MLVDVCWLLIVDWLLLLLFVVGGCLTVVDPLLVARCSLLVACCLLDVECRLLLFVVC